MRSRLLGWRDVALFALLTVVPLLLGGRGRLNADTKQYLYLDPGGLLDEARYLWNPHIGGGTVTHQYVGYLWPMGPYYWVAETIGLPDWVAQRIWIGGIQMVAALGALALFRHLLPRHFALVVSAAAYGLSPFVLGHVVGQSGLLLPFAALGWLVLFAVRAVDEGGWRWPAAFALVVTTCGSLNGSSVFWVVVGASGWALWAAWSRPEVGLRGGAGALARMAALTAPAQLWWLTSYVVSGRYGLDLLAVTETVETTNATTSAAEVVRGLGYWFFYGRDNLGPWLPDLAVPYTRPWLITVSFVVPLAAIAGWAFVRWRHGGYFVALVAVGTILSVGAFPAPGSPLGAGFEAVSRSSGLALSLRNTQRAAPLVVLGLAGLLAAAGSALGRRHIRSGWAALAVVGVAVAGSIPGQWRSGLIGERFHREAVPQAWLDAAAHLDGGRGRVLELPGIDFASHRWGHTLDSVLPGLTDREVVGRDLAPSGGPAGSSLLSALDRSMQEGTLDPRALVPVARLLGVAEIVVRSDLEYERYRTARPEPVWATVTDPRSGLPAPVEFGDRSPNLADPSRPMIDERRLATGAQAETPPRIGVFAVPGGGRERLSAAPLDGTVIVEGDGAGVLDAAVAGLVDGTRPVLLAADILGRGSPVPGVGHLLVVTDTFREAARRWYSLREDVGATEARGRPLVDDDVSDARLPAVPDAAVGHRTVVRWSGAEAIWANAYGNRVTLLADERPSNAFDGNLRTSWRVDTASVDGTPLVGIRLTAPADADHLVVHPSRRIGSRSLRGLEIVLDRTRSVSVAVDESMASDPAGIRVELDGRPFREVEVSVTGWAPDDGPVGVAEVEIPGIHVEELAVVPDAALAWYADAGEGPLAIVLTRRRADPAEVLRADEEPAIRRAFSLARPETVTVTGQARLDVNGDEGLLADLLGVESSWRADSSERLAGTVTTWAASAFDGDPTTAWSTPFVGITDQIVRLRSTRDLRVTALDLEVVVDEWHSTPLQVALAVDDGEPVLVDLPPLEAGPLGTVRAVSVPLPSELAGRSLSLAVTRAEPRFTTDWYSQGPVALPVAVVEVGVPDLDPLRLPAGLDTGCRDDLLEIDGTPVSVRVHGPSAVALAGGPLSLEGCDDSRSLELAVGEHVLRAADGVGTGLHLDQLVLANDRPSGPGGGPAPEVAVTSVRAERIEGRIDSDGPPFWLILDQSVNDGWELTVDGARVSGPHVIDSYGNGWIVFPERAGPLGATVRWRPQRLFDAALLASVLAVAACAVLVVRARRRPERPSGARHEPSWVVTAGPPPSRSRRRPAPVAWSVGLGAAVAAGLLIHPAAAPVAGGVVLGVSVLTMRPRGWAARLVPAALVATGAAAVVVQQSGAHHPLGHTWPQHFPAAHVAVYLGVIVLAAVEILERIERP